MKTIFFPFLLFIFINTAFGQVNFKKGKIITASGDTINGMIEDQNRLRSPFRISFKADNLEKASYFKPSEIKAAILDSGDYYVSSVIEIDMDYVKSIKLKESYSNDNVKIVDTVFLRVIIQGKLSLYLFTDDNFKDHFYSTTKTNSYLELIYKRLPVDRNGIVYLKEVSLYKSQLTSLMSDCPDALNKISRTEYNEKALFVLFRIFNNCLPGNFISYESRSIPSKSSIYLFTGLDITKLYFIGSGTYYIENGNFSNSFRPALGIGINIPAIRGQKKYSALLELAWKQYDTRLNYFFFEYYEYNIHLQMNYLKLNTAFKYSHPGKIAPYINFGPSMALLLHSINTRHVFNHTPNLLPNYSREQDKKAYDNPRKLSFGLFGGIGIKYKKFSFETRYEKYTGFTRNGGLSHTYSFYFLVMYQLRKSAE